ncbi:MAG: rhomboid family protein [Elusimicrobiota bacterium]
MDSVNQPPQWLERAQKRLGFIQIPGLAKFLIGMNAAVGLLTLLNPRFPDQLILDPGLFLGGQVWRAATFLFVPPAFDVLGLAAWILWIFVFLPPLEWMMGDFSFTLICLIGAAATVATSVFLYAGFSNAAFYAGLFLAYARLNPESQILLFFFFPVKIKWIAAAAWIFLAISALAWGPIWRAELACGLCGYMLFFWPDHWRDFKLWIHRMKNRGRF